MAYIFKEILEKAIRDKVDTKNSVKARDWFRETARSVSAVNAEKMMNTADPFTNFQSLSDGAIGKMYCFFYDAKHKKTLPYYDRFPLVFPIESYKDGFLGINLHYLPHFQRALLMDALYQTATNTKMDRTTRLRISYQILSSASRFKYFQPCIKRYLFNHVRSNFMYINPARWEMALFLPTERFVKNKTPISKAKVHSDSLAKVR